MDLATIGYAVDTSGLARGELALDSFQRANNDVAASAGRAQAAVSKTATGMGAMAPAAQGLAKATALASWEVTNLTRQMFDVGVSLASGQSFLMVGIQQGAQIAEIMGQRGVRGALAGVAQGLTALINPTTIALGAITVAGYAASAIWETMREDIKSADDILEEHLDSIKGLRAAYEDAEAGAVSYGSAVSAAMVQSRGSLVDLRKQLVESSRESLDKFGTLFSLIPGRERFIPDKEFSALAPILQEFYATIKTGNPDVDILRKNLNAVAAAYPQNGAIQTYIRDVLSAFKETGRLSDAIKLEDDALSRLMNRPLTRAYQVNATTRDEGRLETEKRQNDRLISAYGEYAETRTASNADVEKRANTRLLAEYQDYAASRVEGQIAAEADYNNRLIGAYQEYAEARVTAMAEADRRGIEARRQYGISRNEAAAEERAKIEDRFSNAIPLPKPTQLATDPGGMNAIIRSGTEEIALLRERISLAGESGAVQERQIALFEAEQEIRRRNIDATSSEAQAIRDNAAARADLTSTLQAQSALSDLQFEREQLSRTSTEQRVYNELKAAGVSAESEFGQQIRASVTELEAARAAQTRLISGMDEMRSATSSIISGLVRGEDVAKMLADRLANFGVSKLTDALLGPSGTAGGGLFGDAMASLMGGGKPMSVATAQITAATVVVNGGVGGNVPSAVAGLAANGNVPAGSSTEIAANLLREREGYRSTPYWDVNAYRVGYGSDTTTDPTTGAVSRVTPGMSIDRMMAEADLSRRIAETQTGIRGQVGAGAWDALNPGTQGALTSVGYNYGSLPQRVIPAVQSGDQNAIATAIEGLSGDNGGINASRRMLEAQMVRESQALAGFGQNVTAATGSVGQFGDGLSSVAQSVLSVPATGGSTATGGGLFGWLGGLFGGGNAPMVLGGARANGGPVNAGEAYVVGERRAELFVPQRSGSIMPSVPGGGSVINFIDQSGNGTRQETKKSRGPNGEEVIDVYVRDKIASETREGGSIDKAFTSRGVSQPLRRRA